jgi:hypothetical protein
MENSRNNNQIKKHVVYDRTTGRIAGTYLLYDAETRSYREQSPDEVRSVFGPLFHGSAGGQYDIVPVDFPLGQDGGGYYIDVKGKKLLPKPRLELKAERPQLQGDGKDSVQIQITVQDASGNAMDHFNGELRVTTTRGRLSAPGGRVKAERGRASIKLASAAETVDKVFVCVRDLAGHCARGTAYLEFV